MEDQDIEMTQTLIAFTSNIVEAYVANNSAELDEIPGLINNVYSALANLSAGAPQEEERPEPAVSVRASVKPDYLVCLEDGKKLKMLKRHLKTSYGLTPDEYLRTGNLLKREVLADDVGGIDTDLDPCAAVRVPLALAPGETREVVFLLADGSFHHLTEMPGCQFLLTTGKKDFHHQPSRLFVFTVQ